MAARRLSFLSTPGGYVPPVPVVTRTTPGPTRQHAAAKRPAKVHPMKTRAVSDVTHGGGGSDSYSAPMQSSSAPAAAMPAVQDAFGAATPAATTATTATSSGGSWWGRLGTGEKIGLGVGAAVLGVGYIAYRRVTAPIRRVQRVVGAGRSLVRAVRG